MQPATRPPILHARPTRHRARRPRRRLPPVRGGRRRRFGTARRRRPTLLYVRWPVEPVALFRRHQRSFVILAFYLPVLVSPAARHVTLRDGGKKIQFYFPGPNGQRKIDFEKKK